jgi:hypothetical protein
MVDGFADRAQLSATMENMRHSPSVHGAESEETDRSERVDAQDEDIADDEHEGAERGGVRRGDLRPEEHPEKLGHFTAS